MGETYNMVQREHHMARVIFGIFLIAYILIQLRNGAAYGRGNGDNCEVRRREYPRAFWVFIAAQVGLAIFLIVTGVLAKH